MRDELVLAIDCGTSSVRALLFDLRGNLVAGARVPFEPYAEPEPGWAEHDPEHYWSCLGEACRRLWAEPAARRDAIVGVALTTQRATVVNLDAEGRALRPAITWLDQRRTPGLPLPGGATRLAFRALGVAGTVAEFQAQIEANWISRHQPEIWAATAHYLLLSGFLTQRLSGRYADSVGCQVGYLPFDYKRLDWARAGDWRWRLGPVAPNHLPELVQPGDRIGEISRAASEATGIPVGLPLVAAAADKACEVLGSGVISPTIGCLSYGTTATINTTHRRYVEPIRYVPPYPAAVAGSWSLEVQIFRGFWMVSWFRREFGLPEEERAAALGVEPEALFDELVDAAPPGSLGLMLQPFWSPGVRVPGPEAKGAIVGFGGVHTRAHVYRALLEGLAYALREGAERIEARTKQPLVELRASGGGSRSRAAVQLTADVFGLPVARPHTPETSGLGAAIDAAVGLGLHSTIETAVAEMTRVADVFEPDPKAHETYDALYRRVYRKLYARLKPLYEEIREITGYPAP